MVLSYIDPNAGSMVAQLAVAGFAGAAVAVKLGWRRAAERLRREPAPGVPEAEATSETHDS